MSCEDKDIVIWRNKTAAYCVKGQLRCDAILDSIKLKKKYRVVCASEDNCRSAVPVNIRDIKLDNR